MDEAAQAWTGDALHRMAADGRVVLTDRELATVLAGIERTLATVHGYLDDLHHARTIGPQAFTEGRLDQKIIDLCVSEMAQPGQLAHALDELAKFAAAFRLIATTSTEGKGHCTTHCDTSTEA